MTEQENVYMEMPKDGRPFLAYFPILGAWDVCRVKTEHAYGLDIYSVVDQWNDEGSTLWFLYFIAIPLINPNNFEFGFRQDLLFYSEEECKKYIAKEENFNREQALAELLYSEGWRISFSCMTYDEMSTVQGQPEGSL